MRYLDGLHAVLNQHVERVRVHPLERRLEVQEEIRGLGVAVALADAVERDDGHALGDGGVELEEAPRACATSFVRVDCVTFVRSLARSLVSFVHLDEAWMSVRSSTHVR